MGTIRITGELLDARVFEAWLDRAVAQTRDFGPLWQMMGTTFRHHEVEVFDSEGPGWKPLSPAYAAWKLAHYGPKPILVRTGELRSSLTIAGAPGNVNRMSATHATFGTTNDHAMYHQTGNLNTSHYRLGTHPPKRPPVTITDGLKREWRSRMADFGRQLVEEG